MTAPIAAICGENSILPAERGGCGRPIAACAEVFRCTDCKVPFHHDCAKYHFMTSMTDDGRAAFGEFVAKYIEDCLAAGLTVSDALVAVRTGSVKSLLEKPR